MSEFEEEVSFIYCEPGKERYWLSVGIAFPVGLVITLILVLLGHFFRQQKIPQPNKWLKYVLPGLTTFMAVIGTGAFFYESSLKFGSLISCSPLLPLELNSESVARWITFLVHIYFFCRAFLAWLCYWDVQIFLTITHIALFTQDIIALVIHQHLLAFHFLVVCSFFCRELDVIKSHILEKLFRSHTDLFVLISKLSIVTVILAGALRAVEEWETNRGLHPDFGGFLSPMRSLWSYVYWVVVTLSTVGYGDYSPSTAAGRALVTLLIIVAFTWFLGSFTKLTEHMRRLGSEVLINDTFDNYGNTPRYLVVGCGSKYQLKAFLENVPNSDDKHIIVYVDIRNNSKSTLHNDFGIPIYQGHEPVEILKACNITAKDFIFIHLTQEGPVELDKRTLHLVKKIKDTGCLARLFVQVHSNRSKVLLHSIKGWRNNGKDICICAQLLDAHMLLLSARSRLITALITNSLRRGLVLDYDENVFALQKYLSRDLAVDDDEITHEDLKFSTAVKTEYFQKGHILLGAISSEQGSLFFPDSFNPDWFKIILPGDGQTKKVRRMCRLESQISTTLVASNVSVIGTPSDCLKTALESHPFPKGFGECPKVKIFECQPEPRHRNTSLLSEAKLANKNGQIFSLLEHTYEACLSKKECLCGCFENTHLSTALFAIAAEDPVLYDFWMYIIEGDHLAVERIGVECTYGDLFSSLVETQRKIPIGVEIAEKGFDRDFRTPLLNPGPDLQLQRGDLVMYLHC